ncbi:MAG: CoA pyrophosphatase [Hyphomicrobiaceae bacterium]
MSSALKSPVPNITVDAFLALAQGHLSPAPSDLIFDAGLGRAMRERDVGDDTGLADDFMIGKPLRRAAVLVGVVAHEHPTVLLTQRTEHLPSHAGQIAFPGGKLEADDIDAVAAAMREAEEEIGLHSDYIRPIGYLDALRTHTGFHVDPVVALIEPGFDLTIEPSEVADAFEVPLAFLMNKAHHQRHHRIRDGRRRDYYAIPYEQRNIWGVTAAIIANMHMRLFAG